MLESFELLKGVIKKARALPNINNSVIYVADTLPQSYTSVVKKLLGCKDVVYGSPTVASIAVFENTACLHIVYSEPLDIPTATEYGDKLIKALSHNTALLKQTSGKLNSEKFIENCSWSIFENEMNKERDLNIRLELINAELQKLSDFWYETLNNN